ncbi:hypothetical protein lacNasYZ03_13130 [Lactobacillus nasalidis]|uniref:O-antigen ligase family protein n=1 Tax=Lactobacillus nasalidis TaxID=2797258 RepID=A0ABQ3W7W1_9LACO|nr:O-antigen ligase family protein [Lactobacillus nasalidis]GHV98430.1 hypothetical protein lacNasYZ01_16120 [Lactobacillus nasalidis]GHV99166.1 hypothetical protein lacNasYZ02_05960 [Lactobacillus nasalidis]GHW01626.1 hypothetical protein lacNasYZ03_13130 [Lactobacillus nasalidis]
MKEKTKRLLYWFIILQPFLDLDFFYRGRLATILPFTIPTIIRIAGVVALAGLLIWGQKKLPPAWVWAYLALLVLYGIAHLWHMQTFRSISPNDYGYSNFGEIFYLFRMLLPLALIWVTKSLEISQDFLLKAFSWVSGLFTGTIVLSNLFVISLKSYETGVISGNIFTWFMGPLYGYSHSASKGFFYFTNTLSAILLMLAPIVFYLLLEHFSWKSGLLALSQTLAMLEVGTKVALYGLIGSLAISLLAWLVHSFLLKNSTFSKPALITLLALAGVTAACYPVSPAVQRYKYEIYWAKSHDAKIDKENAILKAGLSKYKNDPAKLKEFEQDFLAKYYKKYALNKRFITKSYPYKYDPQFWIDLLKQPASVRLANRQVELAMLKQVVKYDNNPLDKWLGIGYMRQTNIFNLERDFTAQYYSLGIIGALLYLICYPAIILYGAFEWLKEKACRTFYLTSLLLASALILGASYMSGNVLDFPTSNLLLAFLDGGILAYVKGSRKQKKA